MFADPFGSVINPSDRRKSTDAGALPLLRLQDPALRQALDKVAGCAAISLAAPLGAVSFVADTQIVLAGIHGFERRTTARAGSFCDEMLRLGTRLLVPDAAADPRFSRHEFVETGGVRAYAGAPIRDDHEIVGVVSAFSGEPEAFRPSGLDDLEALAHMVELLLARPAPGQVELPRLRRQGWIGVRTLDAHRAGMGARAGLTVLSVARGSPAERVGLRPADILYAVDDQILRERADLVAALADREPGSSARLTVQRAGQWLERHVPVASKRAIPGRAG